jgi:anti-sigma regulatory factor (Ser/Thr protein kinase)
MNFYNFLNFKIWFSLFMLSNFISICAVFSQTCICDNNNNNFCNAEKHLLRAGNLLENDQLDSAILVAEKALEIYKEADCDGKKLLNVLNIMIHVSERKGDFTSSMKYNIQANEAAIKIKDYNIATATMLNISNIYLRIGQPQNALQTLNEAKITINNEKNSFKRSGLENKIAARYVKLGEDLKNKSFFDSSLVHSNTALQYGLSAKDTTTSIIAYTWLAKVQYLNNDLEKSKNTIGKIMAMAQENKHLPYIASMKVLSAKIANALNDNTLLLSEAITAVKLSEKHGFPPVIAEAHEILSKAYELNNNPALAYKSYKISTTILDSIKNQDKTLAISSLEKQYNQSKNEQIIEKLSYQKNMLALAGALILFASLLAYLYQRNKLLRQKQIVLETEQRLNRARMNPHFFFNALASLQSFALNEPDSIILAENLSKFSHIMRETLENTYREYVTVRQEQDFLNEYIELQQMRFPGKFDFSITSTGFENDDANLIPSMIVQPFVENCVEHGFSNIDYIGKLSVSFTKHVDKIEIQVIDNGTGLNYQRSEAKPYISRASQIIKDRIYLLNLKLKTNASFSIFNNNEQGVTVSIFLPIIANEEHA